MAHPLDQIFCPLFCPLFRNLVIAYALSLWRRCWVLWFFPRSINLGMDHPLGQLFFPLVFPPLRNLGIVSALSLLGGVGYCGFALVGGIWA